MPASQSFREWLIERENESSPVGHLAYDAAHDPDFPASGDLAVYDGYLSKCHAIPEAFDALYAAWAQYRPETYSPLEDDRARDMLRVIGYELQGYGECRKATRRLFERLGYEVDRRGRVRVPDGKDPRALVRKIPIIGDCELWVDPSPHRDNAITLHVYGCPTFSNNADSLPLQLHGSLRDVFGGKKWISRQRFARVMLGAAA
ncbi:hypothetical protein Mro03_71100 [Microbispora rosea subsp. rosea]|nr:hypothetical protein Mro03_71100 [Microbispora rosea subsp. rosea]